MSEFRFESVVQVKFIPPEFCHNNWQMATDFYLKTWITNRLGFESCPEPKARILAHPRTPRRGFKARNSGANCICSLKTCGFGENGSLGDQSWASKLTARRAFFSSEIYWKDKLPHYCHKLPPQNFLSFLRFYLFIFREEKGGRKRGRETSMCGCLSRAPTGDLAHNPGMCPDWELNQRPFGWQAGTQSTEPHQPGRTLS